MKNWVAEGIVSDVNDFTPYCCILRIDTMTGLQNEPKLDFQRQFSMT